MSAYGKQRGFNRFELLTAVTVIGVLAAVFLWAYQEEVARYEGLFVDAELSALHRMTIARTAKYIALNNREGLREDVGANPFDWLDASDRPLPLNYAGPMPPKPSELRSRTWYFDDQVGQLVYRLGDLERWEVEQGNTEGELRFEVGVSYRDANGNGVLDEGEGIRQLILHTLTPFRWLGTARDEAENRAENAQE